MRSRREFIWMDDQTVCHSQSIRRRPYYFQAAICQFYRSRILLDALTIGLELVLVVPASGPSSNLLFQTKRLKDRCIR